MTLKKAGPVMRFVLCALLVLSLSGCSRYPGWLAKAGPVRDQVLDVKDAPLVEGIQLVEVNDALARKLAKRKKSSQFAEAFPDSVSNAHVVRPGDSIEVSIWESPPAMLFSSMSLTPMNGATATNGVKLPPQMVDAKGTINVPFAGRVRVNGLSPGRIESVIAGRLEGKANQPQVLVRVSENNTSSVTIIGEVNNSTRMPLTPRGERVLDALASAGGAKQSVDKMSMQLSRGERTAVMALDSIVREPKHNVPLKPGDVLAALFQPQSFSVLGATGKNAEIPFEAKGISLAQALARSGGLDDNRADARGVFVFRFEQADLVAAAGPAIKTVDDTIPVVYQVNLLDPSTLFVTQNFPVQNGDVLYVSNAPSAEFQKFLRLVVAVAMPSVTMTRFLEQY